MTKGEIETLQNIIARLKQPNCGCSGAFDSDREIVAANSKGLEAPSRLYLDTWIIGALELLLPGKSRNVDLAVRLSRP